MQAEFGGHANAVAVPKGQYSPPEQATQAAEEVC